MRWVILGVFALAACRQPYVAPEPRSAVSNAPTDWGMTDQGDRPAIRAAEQRCLAGLSPRAVSAAFRAVDQVADALVDLCTIQIVDDDPLVWHVWCGSDATFRSGHYLAPSDQAVQCGTGRAATAFECIGQIVARHLLNSAMSAHISQVEIVSVGSVDEQRLHQESDFFAEPCSDLQRDLALPDDASWAPAEETPSEADRGGLWNRRLSWCRAAFSAREIRRGMSRAIGGRYELAAIGAGTDWLGSYRQGHEGRACPSRSPRRGQCAEARRVDLFIRAGARQGSQAADACTPREGVPGGESGQALYCYADCQARAAIGRNPQGFDAPSAPQNLLFGRSLAPPPEGWVVAATTDGHGVNTGSVRQLLLRE